MSDYAAGNGLLHRRTLLKGGLVAVGALPLLTARAQPRAAWMSAPGAALSEHGRRSPHEDHVRRTRIRSQIGTTGSGASGTPHEYLNGTITPSALHFERHHSGVPAIDPTAHALDLVGRVDRPLRWSIERLHRYPMQSRFFFLECSGNSAPNLAQQAPDMGCGDIHGLVSMSEWGGVPLALLLEEAGIQPEGRWLIAEGADAARMHRSVPLEKALDDAFVALYQNGEAIRPEQGYPMRLFLPGYEGNMSIKWLHRLEVSDQPAMSRQETAKYTDLYADGRAEAFTFEMGVKSVITAPSGRMTLDEPGFYEISGLAWSGRGAIRKVEVSADGGRSWARAQLDEPVLPKSLTRFRLPWHWRRQPAVLMSRADDGHSMQPTRDALIAERGDRFFYHYNAIQCWAVSSGGRITNAYA